MKIFQIFHGSITKGETYFLTSTATQVLFNKPNFTYTPVDTGA